LKSLDINNKALLNLICREFLNFTLEDNNSGLNSDFDGELSEIVAENFTHEILFRNLHPNVNRVLNAIQEADDEIYREILLELINNSGLGCLSLNFHEHEEETEVFNSLIDLIFEKKPSVLTSQQEAVDILKGHAGERLELQDMGIQRKTHREAEKYAAEAAAEIKRNDMDYKEGIVEEEDASQEGEEIFEEDKDDVLDEDI
jgi:hypothetical protein